MSFNDLFDSGTHKRNLGHFAAITTLAAVDGVINAEEQAMLERFARKLDVDETEFKEILQTPGKHPINPPNTKELRLERLYDLFKIIYADHFMEAQEKSLVSKYAIGLGFSAEKAEEIIAKSIKIFGGQIAFEDYVDLLEK